jgi:hypothetical protein
MVMTGGTTRIDTRVKIGRGFQVLMAEQLFHQFESTGRVVKHDLRRQVTEFVRGHLNTSMFAGKPPDKPR